MTMRELVTRSDPSTAAIGAPGREPLSAGALSAQMASVGQALGRVGVRQGDCVAVCLPNGPELAALFVALADCAAAAPLNPAYREAEFEFYLTDLGAKAVVVPEAAGGPIVAAARQCGVPIVGLGVDPARPAGTFTLALPDTRADGAPRLHGAETALLLHTSGTTARPKLVPLTRRNLCLSAANIARALALGPGDVCLNIMPLFHVHGLVAGVLASLGAGAEVWCTPGFSAHGFFRWLNDSRATWCTAVPTMYQTVIARAGPNRDALARHRLRFVRSSSAPLVERVWTQLEETFGVPVLNAYGMTEAAHQISCNPPPPGVRKPGTVGRSGGPEIRVVDGLGTPVPAGTPGEIVLRGETITAGYEHPKEANADAFRDGWFRTGDQGCLDEDGYLTLTGRLKELINVAGEKVSPYEVENVLLQHEAVAQAVCFAVPHRSRGEEVGAAVVLHPGRRANESAVRAFAAERLSKFKTPRLVLVLDELPKGATGKLQRIGLAARLGLDADLVAR